MKKVLITGVSGFIGRKISDRLFKDYTVIGIDLEKSENVRIKCHKFIQLDIIDEKNLGIIFKKYRPDIVIHCAGLGDHGHKQFEHSLINYKATEKISEIAVKENPDVYFIFMSSVSVYGEKNKGRSLIENDPCRPITFYGQSKRKAEKSLIRMFEKNQLQQLDILRLAPVYDKKRTENLEKRVLGVKRLCYFRYGSGQQKLSALAIKNLVNWIEYRLKQNTYIKICKIYNISDKEPYSFNQIIEVFNGSDLIPTRKTITIPLRLVFITIKFLSWVVKSKAKWLNSCYEKLAFSQVFENKKMLDTGFEPHDTLESVFGK